MGPESPNSNGDPASTPFDNPFFLPVLLAAFALWFIYDGWFNPDMEWVRFNRVGAVILVVGAVATGLRAFRSRHPRDPS